MDIRSMVEEFCNVCGTLLLQPEISPEASYRIRKMIDRVAPVVDRTYLKTQKGGETLLQCTEQARRLGEHLDARGDLLYRHLTDLESTCEELLKQTYEFRIKAG